jgi:hypothetical protein
MKYVIFVGDRPSNKNRHRFFAFVGTRSQKQIIRWTPKLGLRINETLLVNASHKYAHKILRIPEIVIVALGKAAHNYLKKQGLEHFTLPHPSGLNRALNDKIRLDEQLKACKAYIEEKRRTK